jgi:hypothetical protein
MMTIPLQVDRSSFHLFIVLEEENIDRLKEHDPAEVMFEKLGEPWVFLHCSRVNILFASAEEAMRLGHTKSKEDLLKQLKELSRGWAYRPDKGDSDAPYQSPKGN